MSRWSTKGFHLIATDEDGHLSELEHSTEKEIAKNGEGMIENIKKNLLETLYPHSTSTSSQPHSLKLYHLRPRLQGKLNAFWKKTLRRARVGWHEVTQIF